MDDWNRSVVKVLNRKTNEFIGTAFFISSNTLLSARHVFENVNSEDILIRGTAWSDGGDRQIELPIFHPEVDACIFTPKKKVNSEIHIPLASEEEADLAKGQTVILLGFVDKNSSVEERKLDIISYEGRFDLEVGENFIPKGYSGGPVLLKSHLVGLIQARHHDENKVFIIRLNSFRDFLKPHISGPNVYTKDTTPSDEELDQTKLPSTKALPKQYRMPYNSLENKFIGRVSDLWRINHSLHTEKTAIVIAGTGGLGKTQLAIEYVHRFGYRYPGGVFWVEADKGMMTVVRIISDNAEIEIDGKLSEKEQIALLWKRLNHFGNDVLIVLDNFPEHGELTPYLPVGKTLFTLVTTRRRDLTQYSRIPLAFLSKKEGLDLLNSGDRKFGKEAEGLIERLAGLPLAMELARNYLNLHLSMTIETLLARLDRTKSMNTLNTFTRKYSDQLPSGHDKEIAATIQLSWDLASENCQRLIQCMAVLAPVPIPRQLLKTILEFSSPDSIEDPFDDAIDEGHNTLSLIELDKDNDPWVHRLISGFVRLTIHEEDKLFEKVIDTIRNETDEIFDEKKASAHRELEKVIPHADCILSFPQVNQEQMGNILSNIGQYYNTKGIYQTAKKYYQRALESDEKSFKPGHPCIATRQSNLALVLKDLGEPEGAKALLTKSYHSFLTLFGENHPRTKVVKGKLESLG